MMCLSVTGYLKIAKETVSLFCPYLCMYVGLARKIIFKFLHWSYAKMSLHMSQDTGQPRHLAASVLDGMETAKDLTQKRKLAQIIISWLREVLEYCANWSCENWRDFCWARFHNW